MTIQGGGNIVQLLEKLLQQRALETDQILRLLRVLDPEYRAMSQRRGGRRFPVRGTAVRLSATPAAVLEILASDSAPKTHCEIISQLKARNRNATRRSVKQAVYHIRLAFKAAQLPADLLVYDAEGWRLTLEPAEIAAWRRVSDKA